MLVVGLFGDKGIFVEVGVEFEGFFVFLWKLDIDLWCEVFVFVVEVGVYLLVELVDVCLEDFKGWNRFWVRLKILDFMVLIVELYFFWWIIDLLMKKLVNRWILFVLVFVSVFLVVNVWKCLIVVVVNCLVFCEIIRCFEMLFVVDGGLEGVCEGGWDVFWGCELDVECIWGGGVGRFFGVLVVFMIGVDCWVSFGG